MSIIFKNEILEKRLNLAVFLKYLLDSVSWTEKLADRSVMV